MVNSVKKSSGMGAVARKRRDLRPSSSGSRNEIEWECKYVLRRLGLKELGLALELELVEVREAGMAPDVRKTDLPSFEGGWVIARLESSQACAVEVEGGEEMMFACSLMSDWACASR